MAPCLLFPLIPPNPLLHPPHGRPFVSTITYFFPLPPPILREDAADDIMSTGDAKPDERRAKCDPAEGSTQERHLRQWRSVGRLSWEEGLSQMWGGDSGEGNGLGRDGGGGLVGTPAPLSNSGCGRSRERAPVRQDRRKPGRLPVANPLYPPTRNGPLWVKCRVR